MKKSSTSEPTVSATRIYTPETRHLFSKEAQYFFEVYTKRAPTQPKYYRAQKRMIVNGTKELFRQNPELPLKEAIMQQLKGLPDFLTGENLVQVVGYIAETWKECQEKAMQPEEEAALA